MMDIVLAGNEHVYSGIELVIYSTMLHNRNIRWHILTTAGEIASPPDQDGNILCHVGLYDQQIQFLEYLVHFMDHKSSLQAYDCSRMYEDHLKGSINAHNAFGPYAALRLGIDLVLPEEVHRCLYLDADVIVQDRLDLMYQYYCEKQNFDFAAYTIPDACNGYGELISGVVFFNLDHIRWSGFLHRARMNYCRKRYEYPDQGALTDAGTALPMLETFNYMEDIKDANYQPAIVHFTNRNKTKIYAGLPGEFYRYYPEYLYLKNGIDKIRECYER